ncbi:MAG: hypothetical protein AMXMBFR59_41040 [Rhodanobacteraceae bacterium]
MNDEPIQGDPTQPRGYLVRLPAVYDSTTGEAHRATIELMMYEPQALEINARSVMNATGFFVDRTGIEIYLLQGTVREHPEHWEEAFDALGLAGEYDGLGALAAVQAICLWLQQRKRTRGARGPGKKNQDARDFLLSAALVRMAKGKRMRQAVCEVLTEYEDVGVVPWRFETAEESLLQMVKRHLKGTRFFVPGQPSRVR